MQVCLKDIMAERFPVFDDWAMSTDANGFAVSMVQGEDPSAILEALQAQITILHKVDDKDDMLTGAVVLFLFGLYLGQSGQGWLDAFKGKGPSYGSDAV